MSISKAFRVLAVVLVAAFLPATALANTPTAAPATGAGYKAGAAKVVKGKGLKLKANKANKATKANKANRAAKGGKKILVRRGAH